MPQNSPNAVIAPVTTTPLQQPISLGASNGVMVGNPGGPVVFANFGSMIVPALNASITRTIVRDQ